MITSPPPSTDARLAKLVSTIRLIAIVHLVVCVLGIFISWDFINNILGIALAASVVAATNSTTDVAGRARAIASNGCITGLSITIFVLGSLSIIVWAAVAFTVGIIFSALSSALNGGDLNGLTPDQRNTLNNACSQANSGNGVNGCKALAATFGYIAAAMFLSLILAILNIGLTAGILCNYNAITAQVGSANASAGGSVTVVMMPQAVTGMPNQPGAVNPVVYSPTPGYATSPPGMYPSPAGGMPPPPMYGEAPPKTA